ncbi:MAG: FoF1 ATP synthase subunit gamma [Candidatus Omnitrophota bacterium]
MKTLAILKKDMEFNSNLFSLIEALKNIAVAQFKILERKIRSFDRLMLTVESFFALIDTTRLVHPFFNPQGRPQAVVAVTSDSGLLGGLNIQVVNRALYELTQIPGKLIVIGDRGKMYAKENGVPFVAFSGIKDEERYSQAMQVRDYMLNKILDGTYGHLKVVYPRPVSFTVQCIEVASFLPFVPKGSKADSAPRLLPDMILESNPNYIAEYLLYLWIGHKFYEIFGLSRLAELAARFVHLEDSSQKLKDMEKKIKLEYFRVRHEIIDRNMRELFATRLMYAYK